MQHGKQAETIFQEINPDFNDTKSQSRIYIAFIANNIVSN